MLFNIYVRNIPVGCTSDTYQFADDTTHSEADKDPQVVADKLTNSLKLTQKFCADNELILNAEKTQFKAY